MAYGKKYNYYLYWDHNSSNNYFEVAFFFDGYASTVTELTPGTNPLEISIKGQRDTLDEIVMGSEARMEFILNTKASVSTYDTDFLEGDYKDVIVKIIQDPSGTPATKWTGILTQESSQREYLGYKYLYSIAAVDGLAALKDVYYSSSGTPDGSPYSGFEDGMTIIKTAISKVADFTELQHDFYVQLGTYSDQMTSTENALKENEFLQDVFYVEKEGDYTFDTCYQVLEKMLNPFYCNLVVVDNIYQIICSPERSSHYFEYDWATLTQQSRTSRSRSLALIPIASTGFKFFGKGTLTKTPGIYYSDVVLYNKDANTELVTNSGFNSNVTGWTNGDSDDNSNQWDSLAWYNYGGLGGTASAQWAGAATAGSYHFHSSAITVDYGAGKENVIVKVRVEWNAVTPAGTSAIDIRIRLYNGTDTFITGSAGYQSIGTVGGFYVVTETFDAVSAITAASNNVDVEIRVNDASTTSIQMYFDYVSAKQASDSTPSDWRYRMYPSGVTFKSTKEKIIYFADQPESVNDMCGIKDSGGTFTSTWTRYGKTETLLLTRILSNWIANDNSAYMDYVRCQAYDESQEIEAYMMPYNGTTYHRIIGMTKNYRDATVDLELLEVRQLSDSDSSITFQQARLNSQYGQDI